MKYNKVHLQGYKTKSLYIIMILYERYIVVHYRISIKLKYAELLYLDKKIIPINISYRD